MDATPDRPRGDLARVRLERLQALTEALSAAPTREDVTRIVFDRALGLVDASAVTLFWERTPGKLELLHGLGLSDDFVRRFRAIGTDEPVPAADAFRAGDPVWLASRSELAARYPTLLAFAEGHGIQAWAALPVASGGARGALSLQFPERRAFDDEERRFVLAVARQCQQALDRARLYDEQKQLAERLQQLHTAASALSAATGPQDVAVASFRALASLGVSAVEIHLLEGLDRVVLAARYGRGLDRVGRFVPIDAPTAAAEVVRTGRALWLESREEIAAHHAELASEPGVGAFAVVPLLVSGKALGALAVALPAARKLEPDDRTFVRLVAQPAAAALERARLFEEATRSRAEAEWTAALLAGTYVAAPVGLALLDRDMRFVRVNGVFGKVDGLPPDAHVGRRPVEVLPGVSGEQVEAAFRSVLDTGAQVEREMVGETPGAPGISRRWMTSWYPVRVGGEMVGVGVVVRESA